MLTWARGSICVFPQDKQDPIWVPERLVRKVQQQPEDAGDDLSASPHEDAAGNIGKEMGNTFCVPQANASSP